jgi:hypothetical protein
MKSLPAHALRSLIIARKKLVGQAPESGDTHMSFQLDLLESNIRKKQPFRNSRGNGTHCF